MKPIFRQLRVMAAMLAACAAIPAFSQDYFATNAPPGAGVPSDGASSIPLAPAAGPDCACCECDMPWRHRSGVFGEFLYLRSRDSKVAFAEVVDGPAVQGVVPVQFGQLTLVDEDYSPAFRVGGSFALDCDTSIVGAYTHFESDTQNSEDVTDGALFIRSLVTHPSRFVAGQPPFALTTAAFYDIDYDLVDLDYRAVLCSSCTSAVNYVFGARYARLEQEFGALFSNAGFDDATLTSVRFEGAGLRAGLDAERHACRGLMFYGKGMANFIAGEFDGRYRNNSTVDQRIVDIDWTEGRLIAILEFELGLGWTSKSGRLRATAGYMVSAWYNMVKTDEFIDAVQTNDYVDIGGVMTFDGLTSRVEVRF